MKTMNGKHSFANIMIDQIDETTESQIQTFLDHPAFKNTYIAVMPDCHAGKGAVIGFTMKMNDYVIPNVVGVDIGCGMTMGRFETKDVDLAKLDAFIKQSIPHGFSINQKAVAQDVEFIDRFDGTCRKIDIDPDKALRGLGSLGGGNHFIEAGRDQNGKLCVTIHSGSRNFGLRVADYFQNKAKDRMKDYFIGDQYKDLEFLPSSDNEFYWYMQSLYVAQEFADRSRKEMLSRIAGFLGQDPSDVIVSTHNFIDPEDQIIRKGATPAREGQDVIIPFNMRDGIALCKGKGSKKYNFSAPHGAGRILSRRKAKEKLSAEAFVQDMKDSGIYTTTACASTLDESPEAYKDMQVILDNIEETVTVSELIKPIYNFKSK